MNSADAGPPLFDTDFLRRLERLELLAKKVFRGLLRGEHSSSRRGRSLEFADFRRYRPGDDFRAIDWNIYSRLDRLFLKLYAAEEDLTLHLLLDASASMGFGAPLKFDYARQLTAALAYIGLHNAERVNIIVFRDHLDETPAPLRGKSRAGTPALLRFLSDLQYSDSGRGAGHFGAPLSEFAARYTHPGLVVLISDLLASDEHDENDLSAGLQALRRRGHDVTALHTLAEEDIEPPLDGPLKLIDAEHGGELKVTVDAELRALYQAQLERWLDNLQNDCRRRGINYLRTSTAVPFEDLVLKYLRHGALLR